LTSESPGFIRGEEINDPDRRGLSPGRFAIVLPDPAMHMLPEHRQEHCHKAAMTERATAFLVAALPEGVRKITRKTCGPLHRPGAGPVK